MEFRGESLALRYSVAAAGWGFWNGGSGSHHAEHSTSDRIGRAPGIGFRPVSSSDTRRAIKVALCVHGQSATRWPLVLIGKDALPRSLQGC